MEQEQMKLKFKKLSPKAVTPKYAKEGDACMDITAISCDLNRLTMIATYHTGLAFEIPKGYVMLCFPRSSIRNTDLRLSNCVGVIDSGYRGEIMASFDVFGPNMYNNGDRIFQVMLVPYPHITLEEVQELGESERGEGGFGHTGK